MLRSICNVISDYKNSREGIAEILNIMYGGGGYSRAIPGRKCKRNSNRKKNKKTNYKRKKSK